MEEQDKATTKAAPKHMSKTVRSPTLGIKFGPEPPAVISDISFVRERVSPAEFFMLAAEDGASGDNDGEKEVALVKGDDDDDASQKTSLSSLILFPAMAIGDATGSTDDDESGSLFKVPSPLPSAIVGHRS
mmetsp:Transcript_14934/g.33224  ORF Transcript_14934/g.33224 Transcript_14934/m.33224 type:complete len:131 (+) Transcript_14934:2580-2972(+)